MTVAPPGERHPSSKYQWSTRVLCTGDSLGMSPGKAQKKTDHTVGQCQCQCWALMLLKIGIKLVMESQMPIYCEVGKIASVFASSVFLPGWTLLMNGCVNMLCIIPLHSDMCCGGKTLFRSCSHVW